METNEMIDKILKRYNKIKKNKAQILSKEFTLSNAFENGEINSIQWILINVFNFEITDKRF